MLIAEIKGKRVEASAVERGAAYCCPGCRNQLILKRGGVFVPHFAHKPNAICNLCSGETPAHLTAKQTLCNEFRRRGLRAEMEVPIRRNDVDRRADVLVEHSNGQRMVFELQHSTIDTATLQHRIRDYASQGIAQMWLPFLRTSLLTKAQQFIINKDILIERAAILDWEHEIHKLHKEKLWMWDPQNLSIVDVTIDDITIFIEEAEYYTIDGHHVVHGGYHKTLIRDKEWHIAAPADLKDTLFKFSSSRGKRIIQVAVKDNRA